MPGDEIVIVNGRFPIYGGSNGNVVQTAPDVNYIPGRIPVPFPNSAPNRLVGQNRTTHSFIRDFPIGVSNTHVGPLSNPFHPGFLKGTGSNTYRLEARPRSWSNNVRIEGRGVVRHGDLSVNNHFNTTGMVKIGADGKLIIDREWQDKLKCKIVMLSGIGMKGRKLGWADKRAWHKGLTFGQPTYLEVLNDETVVFRVMRLDMTKPSEPAHPTCDKGHTHWEVEYTTYPARRKQGFKAAGDAIPVPTYMAIDSTARWLQNTIGSVGDFMSQQLGVGMIKLQEDGMKEYARQFPWSKSVQDSFGFMDSDPVTVDSLKANIHHWGGGIGGQYKDVEVHKHTKTARNVGLNALQNLGQFIKLLSWALMPPTVMVTAKSCAGSAWAQLVVYPTGEFNFSFSMASEDKYEFNDGKAPGKKDAELDKVLKAIKTAKVGAKLAQKIFSLGGSKLDVTIAHGLELSCKVEYKRCTKLDSAMWGTFLSTPASVGSAWTIKLKCERLLGANSEIAFSLWKLIPYVGPVAERVLNKLGLRCEVYFGIGISAWIEGQFGMNEYKHLENPVITATFRIRPFGGVRVGYFPKGDKFDPVKDRAKNAAAGLIAEMDFPVTAEMEFSISEERGEILICKPRFEVKMGFFAIVKGWKIFQWELVPHTYPESLTYNYPPKDDEVKFVLISGAQ